jgi:hypothetical protein
LTDKCLCWSCQLLLLTGLYFCCQQARMVAAFEDNSLWYPGLHHSNTVYITDAWMVSLCRVSELGGCLHRVLCCEHNTACLPPIAWHLAVLGLLLS